MLGKRPAAGSIYLLNKRRLNMLTQQNQQTWLRNHPYQLWLHRHNHPNQQLLTQLLDPLLLNQNQLLLQRLDQLLDQKRLLLILLLN